MDYLFSSTISAIGAGTIGYLVAIVIPMSTYDKQYSFNIEALNDNESTSGKLFLGSGWIEGKMKYVFYLEDNGLYRMRQLDSDLVRIRYSDGTPKVNVTEKYPTDSFINLFAIDFDCFDKTYIIEVPNGSINNDYKLDAQ